MGAAWPGRPICGASRVQLSSNQQFPIAGFQVNLIGEFNGAMATFASGQGTLTYSVPSGTLCANTGGPGDACLGALATPGCGTQENSNASYGAISSCCGSPIVQSMMT